ncbi:MAG: hypothetical protein JXA99_11770 [Candidatus Lokiarchaeota archaeon]|nr:hypothetical protein [Candidatus Lokiarchaeota archaeon]
MKKILFLIFIFACFSCYFLFIHFNGYYFEIPIEYGSAHTPCINVEIDSKKYLLEVDLGAKGYLTVKKSILENLNVKKLETSDVWYDLKGKKYQTPNYLLSEIKVGPFLQKDVIINEETDEFIDNVTLWNEETDDEYFDQGSIQRDLLKKFNFLIDCNRGIFIFSNNKNKLRNAGYNLKSYIKVPFSINNYGMMIVIDTVFGIQNFSFDTGASVSCIKSNFVNSENCKIDSNNAKYFLSGIFKIENENYGNQDLYLFDISNEFIGFDGVLGMDFIKKHVCYIDFEKGYLYIQKPVLKD